MAEKVNLRSEVTSEDNSKDAVMTSSPGGKDDQLDEQDPSFVDDDGVRRCGVPKTTADNDEPCRCPISTPRLACQVHGSQEHRIDAVTGGEVTVIDGIGSGDPDHKKGNGSPPEGNKNGMSHGIHAAQSDPWGVMEHFAEERPAIHSRIVCWFWDDIQNASFPAYIGDETPDKPLEGEEIPPVDIGRLTSQAADLLLVNLDRAVTMMATLQQVEDGLAHAQQQATDQGVVEVIDENPVNLPKNRMRREDRQQLKDLGLRDQSPDAQAAAGRQGLAAAAERVANARDNAGTAGHPPVDDDD